MILNWKHPQNGSLKGIATSLLAAGPQGKLVKTLC